MDLTKKAITSIQPPDPKPIAWLGFAPSGLVRICAWCPDKDVADQIAKDNGLRVTHTCCEVCHEKQVRDLGKQPS